MNLQFKNIVYTYNILLFLYLYKWKTFCCKPTSYVLDKKVVNNINLSLIENKIYISCLFTCFFAFKKCNSILLIRNK